ncbi:response regulator [Psychrobium sp. MM17-31]|uniref:hybrid sensor histidine kinase/response regulator n=1 Tax=Psychrobium sp. MM17-31 TaxID=2917758 RepID=UPI001EF4CE8E|nr:response regulator [Psychrobium sp. MM17-31]MCG7532802.1 response regulator [Psychrobium sp. MM17-31]
MIFKAIKFLLIFVLLFNFEKLYADELVTRLAQLESNLSKDLYTTLQEIESISLETDPNSPHYSRLHNLAGYGYILAGDYTKSFGHLTTAQKNALRNNNQYELAESLRFQATIYTSTNLQNESLPLFLEALEIHKKIGSKKVTNTLQGISLYYRSLENYAKYLEYGRLLLKHPNIHQQPQLKGIAQYTIGEGLLKLDNLDEAAIYLNTSIATLSSISSILVSEAFISLAELEVKKGNFQSALKILRESQNNAKENNYGIAISQGKLLEASTYLNMERFNLAKQTYLELIEGAETELSTLQVSNKKLAEIYEQEGNYQRANIHLKKYADINEQLTESSDKAKSAFYNARLNLEHKELQITQLEADKALQDLAIKQKEKTEQLRDAILALLVLILVSLAYYVIYTKRTKNQMKALAEEANLANKAKSNFLAKMSHEIRTPMNAIIGLSQLALNAKLNPKQRENISMVHASSQSLLTLLNDILDFSKIEAKKLELEHADFLLNNSIQRLLNVCSFSAEEKQLKLNVHIDNDVPTSLTGDALRLEQILINLVNNAIKFTEQGDININVSLVKHTENINSLKFSVTDYGIGIGEEQLQRLFKAFSQADVSVTRRYGGTGLGLTICKELVELMNGNINVESELGKGSCFSFTVDIATSKTLSDTLSNEDLSNLNNLKILIVDDSKSSRTLLSETLIDLGLECAQARSGVEALEQIKDAIDTKLPYDIVLMDWRMPGLDGLETIRIINQVVNEQLPKFILVSSFDKSDAIKLSRHLPVEDVLEKPIKPSQLTSSLLTIVNGNSNKSTTMSPSPTAIIKRNFSEIKLLIAEDNRINQKVIEGFLSDTHAVIDIVSNGVEAVEKAKNNSYHLILMDVQMPEMDGLTAAKLIREFDAHTPILAMTAHSLPEDIEQSMAAGMNEHLTKPINANLLIETIANQIKN